MRLALGTVQFGLAYGIANQTGRTSEEEVRRILTRAAAAGISVLDTAPGYGESEAVLGACLRGDDEFDIVTKTPARGDASIDWIERNLSASLDRLGRSNVYGPILHSARDLASADAERVFDTLQSVKASGRAGRIGISVYDAGEIDAVVDRFDVDLIQLPINVLDQRLLTSGHLDELRRRGIEIHARSVFLQGLLLLEPSRVPSPLAELAPRLAEFRRAMEARGATAARGALDFVSRIESVDRILVGVETEEQLEALLAEFRPLAGAGFDYSPFAVDDERLVNPHRWNTGASGRS